MTLRALMTRLKNLARSTASHNSSLGIVNFLSGATLDVEQNK
jgi:hypothetical protein